MTDTVRRGWKALTTRNAPLKQFARRWAMCREFDVPFASKDLWVSTRGMVRFDDRHGEPVVVKSYSRRGEGPNALERELEAHRLFGDRAWKIPVVDVVPNGVVMQRMPAGSRLDEVANRLNPHQRLMASAQILEALLEIYMSGHIHGDVKAPNIYFVENHALLGDYESFWSVSSASDAFLDSYDVRCFEHGHADTASASPEDESTVLSLCSLLGIGIRESRAELLRWLDAREVSAGLDSDITLKRRLLQ